jgi:UDP-N-acetylglucosamine transferase subunit ALG13
LRQLLDLEPVWAAHDPFFVTEDTAIADDLAKAHKVFRMAHYGIGQARIGKPFALVRGATVNFFQSLALAFRQRPDIVISTGAGAVFWSCLFFRLRGARFILIESFARFDKPSKFGRVCRLFASDVVVQSAALSQTWPSAHFFDPFKRIEGKRPEKSSSMLATVGAILPFDRMSEAVLALKQQGAIPEALTLQTGVGSALAPAAREGLRIVETLSYAEIRDVLKSADLVICHGGTGSLVTALREGCRIVAMPRRHDMGEVYDDHQFEIAEAFAARGLVEMAKDADALPAALTRARAREPVMATTDPAALIAWLENLLARLA